MSKQKLRLLGLASIGTLACAVQPTRAQSAATTAQAQPSGANTSVPADTVATGEIVVTAQKRSERIQDVPLSINAATGLQLKSLGIVSTDQLDKLVPGFTFQKTEYGLPVFFIRGIGFNDTTLGVSPAVSVYVDQQPLPFSPMSRGAVLDLERVEVLKGPQGTLFGENSTGGAINFIAAKPTDHLIGGVDLTYGRFNELDAEAFVSGPITDKLLVRVAARSEYQQDWQRGYTTNETLGERRFENGRITVDWKPRDTVRLELTASGWVDKSDVQQRQLVAYTPLVVGPTARPLPFPLSTFPPAPRDPRAAAWDPGGNFARNDSLYQLGGRLEVDLTDRITLTSLTSYASYKQSIPTDVDGTTYSSATAIDLGHINTFSQEVRLSGTSGIFKWMVGGNYEHDKVSERLSFNPLITSGTAVGPFTFDTLFVDNLQRISSKSGFGSLDVGMTRQLTLQGSVRYTQQDRGFAGCDRDTGNGQLSAAIGFLSTIFTGAPQTIAPGACTSLGENFIAPPIITGHLNQDNLSWRASLNWKPTRDTLFYGNVTKGYKAGSFPTFPAALAAQLQPVTQESVLAYEIGAKVGALQHRIQFDGALFYYDYRDKQLLGYILDPVFGPLSSLVSIPKTHVQGAEVGLTLRPLEGLTLAANGTYVDTRIDSNPINPTGPFGTPSNFIGQSFPYTPRWQGSLDAQYRFPVTGRLFGFVGGTATGRTSTTGSLLSGAAAVAEQEALLRIRGYTVYDVRAGIESADGVWRLEAFGRNVTNQFYVTGINRNSDFTSRFSGAPATYGVTARFRFN